MINHGIIAVILAGGITATAVAQNYVNEFADDDFGLANEDLDLGDFNFDEEFIEFDTGLEGEDGSDFMEGTSSASSYQTEGEDDWLNSSDQQQTSLFDNPDEVQPPLSSELPLEENPPALLTTDTPASDFEMFQPPMDLQNNDETMQTPSYDFSRSPYAPLPMPDRGPRVQDLIEPNEFGGAAAIPDSRRLMAPGEAPDEYRVRAGDTLFDICDQLIDEADYWPKLWALNPEIKNPHFIYPGMRLQFYPGDDSTPPYLQVIDEDEVVPFDMAGFDGRSLIAEDMANLLFEDFSMSATQVGYAEELNLPASFGDVQEIGEYRLPSDVQVMVPGFIYHERQSGLATVVGGASGLTLVGPSEDVVIQGGERLQPGSTYTVLRDSGRVDDPRSRDFIGYRYEFVAHVRIKRDLGDDFYQATPTVSRLGVQPGDIIVDYRSTQRNVSLAGANLGGGGEGVILGFDYPHQNLGGEGTFIFISERLSPGAIVPVFQYMNERALGELQKILPEADEHVGVVRIIDATDSASLGYVLKTTKGIRVGDLIGKG